MADSWLGTTDSLSLKQLANEQINSQSQPCCLTSRPLPLQDNCLDCALCLRECLYQWANRTGEAWEARKSLGPKGGQESHQPPFRSCGSTASQTEGSIDPLHSTEASRL